MGAGPVPPWNGRLPHLPDSGDAAGCRRWLCCWRAKPVLVTRATGGTWTSLVYRLEKDGDLRRVWKAGQSSRPADGSMRTSITGCLCRMTSGYTYFSITTMHGPIAAPAQIEECTGTRRGNHFGVPAGSLSVECLRHRGQGMGFKPGASA